MAINKGDTRRREKKMETIACIDLCERLQALYEETPDFNKLLDHISRQAGFNDCKRVYIGSSFCGHYFLMQNEKQIEALAAVCKERQIKLSLVVPVLTEKYLEQGKEKIKKLSGWFHEMMDEVVVNDYGMLPYIKNEYGQQVKLVMGRLFVKDYRDPRYEDYFEEVCYPKIFTPYLTKLIETYQVGGMLFDASHKAMDFSEKPPGIEIGIYEPYTYITTGHICEMGATHQPIEKKFRPNGACRQECLTEQLHYFMEDGRKWLRLGRTVYFENREVQIRGITSYRRLYCPFDEEEKR